jgi:DNA (cytosine-5)-methyltransferase 1
MNCNRSIQQAPLTQSPGCQARSALTVGSLFSGIGGFDLGLERAGLQIRWQVEIDPWCRAVLAQHWPAVPRYHDIRTLTGKELEHVDVLCGGFPCQPVSVAGRRRAQADERWLWPEFARLVRTLRPRYVLVENVPGLLTAGMGDILRDLAACGFDAEWDSLRASDFGAPHRRERIWLVAYADGRRQLQSPGREQEERRRFGDGREQMADADGARWEGRIFGGERPHQCGERPHQCAAWARSRTDEDDWLARSGIRRVSHGVPNRLDRLRGLGNALVPQIAEWLGRRLVMLASSR